MVDKGGVVGTVIAAASCPACFPALASLGSALGLGFLAEYEGLLISTLLPIFAGAALVANGMAWFSHRHWFRCVIGMAGPVMVLLAVLFFMGQWWTPRLLYPGLALMVAVSLWDLFARRRPVCAPEGCKAG